MRRCASFALCVMLFSAGGVVAQPVPRPIAPELRPTLLRERIAAYMLERPGSFAPFQGRVVLDARRLDYSPGETRLVLWRVQPAPGVVLTAAERAELRRALAERLREAVARSGLLREGKDLLTYRVDFEDAPPPRTEVPTVNDRAGAAHAGLVAGSVAVSYGWCYLPSPWGCYFPGSSNLTPMPIPSDTPPAAMPPADATAAVPPATAGRPIVTLRMDGRVYRVADLTAKDAQDLYWRGYKLYWKGAYLDALDYLEVATRLADDARYWYYKALTEMALGDRAASQFSLERAVVLHLQGKPRADIIGVALERIQGPKRLEFRTALERSHALSLGMAPR